MFKIVIGFTVVGIFLVLVSSVKGETPVKSALELMEKICRNPNLAREAAQSQSIRFGADAKGSLFIRFVGSVAAGLGYTAEQKSGEGFRGQLRPEDLTALLKGEQECQKEFKDVLLSTLLASIRYSAKIVAIDSQSYDSKELNQTNGNEIEKIIVDRVRMNKDDIHALTPRPPENWDPRTAIFLNPEVIFIHWSSFETDKQKCSIETSQQAVSIPCNQRFFRHFTTLAEQTDAIFVIYTRSAGACNRVNSLFKNALNAQLISSEKYLNRALFIEMNGPPTRRYPNERNGSFRSVRSQSDIGNLARILLFDGGVDKVAKAYLPKEISKNGICLLNP